MKRSQLQAVLFLTTALSIPAHLHAQLPTGTDIDTAIPIYFGQIINDLGDKTTTPLRVYSMVLAKGQQISAMVSSQQGSVALTMFPSTMQSVVGCGYNDGCSSGYTAKGSPSGGGAGSSSLTATITSSGTYYFVAFFGATGITYSLQVTSVGTPITSPLPTQAGCLTGQVDYLTYSLQLISAGLPDTASIGGTQMCATCTVKPPAYPEIVSKMETSIGLGATVSACYDATGNIFQITLKHP